MSKKESATDLAALIDKEIRVKLSGGREITGVLKGYDQLMNLVLAKAVEYLRDPEDPYKITDDSRYVGLAICRGTAVMMVAPMDGMKVLSQNPFEQEIQNQ